MSDILQGLFPETLEKDILRLRDKALIRSLMQKKGRGLTYAGLAGVNARDILRWSAHLSKVVIIERPFKNTAEQLLFKTELILKLTPIFNGNITIAFEDVWQYLTTQKYINVIGSIPDIVNLDFCGGMIYETQMEYPKQRQALQELFAAAQTFGEDFLILITLMPRDKGKETYKKFLRDHLKQLIDGRNKGQRSTVESNLRFHERNNLYLFKACLPIFVSDIARAYNFQARTQYIRLYQHMIHIAILCRFVPGVLGLALDAYSLIKNMNAPIRKLLPSGEESQELPPQIDSTMDGSAI